MVHLTNLGYRVSDQGGEHVSPTYIKAGVALGFSVHHETYGLTRTTTPILVWFSPFLFLSHHNQHKKLDAKEVCVILLILYTPHTCWCGPRVNEEY